MIASNGLPVRAFFGEQFQPLKLRGKSANTRRLYNNTLARFDQFLGRQGLLSDFTDDTISRHIGWIVDRGRSPYTANKHRSQLLAIWRFACRKGFLTNWPDVEPEIEPVRVPRAWNNEQLDRLFAACLETPGRIGPIKAGLWWYAMHLLGWDTGERIAPLRMAEWHWIDLERAQIRVPAEARKGKRADRVYQLHRDTVEVLRLIQCPIRLEVFPWPFSPTHIYHKYAEIQRRAGLPTGRQFRFHCLRKSVASHGKAAGMDPQELMGHVDGRTTRKYLDPTICGGRPASEVLFRPKVNEMKADPQKKLFE